jgi:hypothetical protein
VRLFALDQNFPQPIVDGLRDWLKADVELVPIAKIDNRLATEEHDWRILLALHNDERPWDGLITTDDMTALPREVAVLCQTKLTLVVAVGAGHDPIMATGLVLAYVSNICKRTRTDRAQVWRLRARGLPAEDPWAYMERIAEHRHMSATDLYAESKLSDEELASSPLLDEPTE